MSKRLWEGMQCCTCKKRSAHTRGNCHACYLRHGHSVRLGKTSWSELEAQGLAMPPRQPDFWKKARGVPSSKTLVSLWEKLIACETPEAAWLLVQGFATLAHVFRGSSVAGCRLALQSPGTQRNRNSVNLL